MVGQLAYFNASRQELIDFLRHYGSYQASLDIGCAAGCFGRQLLNAHLTHRCDGLEPNQEVAAQAMKRLHRVWATSFESGFTQIPWSEYDLVIMADVLEHLLDPWQALREIQHRVRPSTHLLLSVPNIRHKCCCRYCSMGGSTVLMLGFRTALTFTSFTSSPVPV